MNTGTPMSMAPKQKTVKTPVFLKDGSEYVIPEYDFDAVEETNEPPDIDMVCRLTVYTFSENITCGMCKWNAKYI